MRNQGSQSTKTSSEIGKRCIWKEACKSGQEIMVNTISQHWNIYCATEHEL